MITLEEKLSQFKELVNTKVDNENLKLIDEKKLELDTFLDEEQLMIAERQKKNTRLATERIDRQKKEIISTIAQEQRRDILRTTDQFMSILLNKVEEKCKTFVQSEEYPKYIAKVMENTLKKEELSLEEEILVTLGLSNYTSAQKNILDNLSLIGYKNIRFEEGDGKMIGGFIIQISSKNLRINKTIESAIESRKEDIGRFMQEYIREEGAN